MPPNHRVRIPVLAGAVIVTALDDDERREIERTWARCRPERVDAGAATEVETDAPGSESSAVTVVDREAFREASADVFYEHLVSTATMTAIRSRRGDRILLHGAALAHPDTGTTIALVAASGTGKTTATKTLGRQLAYLTDETVSIDADLAVEPFEKPLSMLDRGARPKTQRSPDELGLLPARGPGRLGVLAVLHRSDDHDPASATADVLTLLEGVHRVIEQSSSLFALDRGLVRLCRVIDACGGVVALRYREAERLVDLVDRLLADPPTATRAAESVWAALDPSEWRVESGDPDAPGTWVRRREPADAVLIDGRIAILSTGGFTALDGIGAVLWQAASHWSPAEELTAAVVSDAGPHPDAARLVAEAIDELVDLDVLERRDVS